MALDSSTHTAMLVRVRSGDPVAFEELVRQYHPELFRFALRWLKNKDDTDDLLQDVLLSVWRNYTTIATDIPLRPYLYRAVRNALINARRSQERAQFLYHDPPVPESIPDSTDIHETLEHQELHAAIERTLANLPARCREVWVLVRERGLSYGEAAQVLEIAPGTVHVQMSRAFAAIRKSVGPLLGILLAEIATFSI